MLVAMLEKAEKFNLAKILDSLCLTKAAALALNCATGSFSPQKATAQSTEYWSTSEGELQLQSQGNNNYRGSFQDNTLHGTKSNTGNFLGHWINNRRNTLRCSYPINGSFYWGAVN